MWTYKAHNVSKQAESDRHMTDSKTDRDRTDLTKLLQTLK